MIQPYKIYSSINQRKESAIRTADPNPIRVTRREQFGNLPIPFRTVADDKV